MSVINLLLIHLSKMIGKKESLLRASDAAFHKAADFGWNFCELFKTIMAISADWSSRRDVLEFLGYY
jgi:hypothetical protein